MRASLATTMAAAVLLMGCGGPPAAAPTVTVTATTTTTVTVDPPTPTPEAVATFEGKPEDWEVTIRVTEMKCFGSAGCNVTYTVESPKYKGVADLPATGTIEVTYEVVGVEDAVIATFTVRDGQVEWDGTGTAGVKSKDSKISTKVTNVTYRTY